MKTVAEGDRLSKLKQKNERAQAALDYLFESTLRSCDGREFGERYEKQRRAAEAFVRRQHDS